MKTIDDKPYYSLNHYYHQVFKEKTYKIALDIGSTCPNRDGNLDSRGCIFCSNSGSGEYATGLISDLNEQIERAISLISHKYSGKSYIAYLQSYSNTYGDTESLIQSYEAILNHPKINGLSIATRPDCLDPELINAIARLSKEKPIWIELGLQSIHVKSEQFIRRSYPLKTFNSAIVLLSRKKIPTVVHLIAGLPSETYEDFLESVHYIGQLPIQGIKFHSLHVLEGTDLGKLYKEKAFHLPSLEDYCHLIVKAISLLPEHIVIHRLTGDPPKKSLIEPRWSLDKRKVLNTIHKTFKDEETWQGKLTGGSYEG